MTKPSNYFKSRASLAAHHLKQIHGGKTALARAFFIVPLVHKYFLPRKARLKTKKLVCRDRGGKREREGQCGREQFRSICFVYLFFSAGAWCSRRGTED